MLRNKRVVRQIRQSARKSKNVRLAMHQGGLLVTSGERGPPICAGGKKERMKGVLPGGRGTAGGAIRKFISRAGGEEEKLSYGK